MKTSKVNRISEMELQFLEPSIYIWWTDPLSMGITGVHIQGFFKVVLTSDARNFFSCTTHPFKVPEMMR